MPATTRQYQGALTGNLITIQLDGHPIGLIQSLQAQEDFGLQPISGIGNVAPVEHAPGTSRINLSCETIYISLGAALMGNTPVAASPMATNPPLLGGSPFTLESTGIVPKEVGDILMGNVFDIVVQKIAGASAGTTATSNIIRHYVDCSYAGGSISFQKHQIVMQSATFMALGYKTV